MLSTFKQFFDEYVSPEKQDGPADIEHRLQVAAAALLIEVARADFNIELQELTTTSALLKQQFSLTDQEVDSLLQAAQQDAESSSSLHQFTSLLMDHWDLTQRTRAMEKMWRVALADGNIDKHERHLLKKVAALLYVPQNEFVAAKIRAEKQLGTHT